MNIYFIKRWILRRYFKLRGKTPLDMPMVRYWRKSETAKAKFTTLKDGSLGMFIEGEDYPISGISRGYMLFGNYRGTGYGPLSVLKHTIKNEIFNYIWYAKERGETDEQIIKHIKEISLPKIKEITDDLKYDMIPPDKMFSGVRELWRALSLFENAKTIRDALVFIMMDDDSYISRLKWIIQIFNPSWWWSNPIKDLDIAFEELENAEVVGDMKERIRLLRKGVSVLLKDPAIKDTFLKFCKEMDWNKLKLTKADKYHFRAKYFKVDLDKFEY